MSKIIADKSKYEKYDDALDKIVKNKKATIKPTPGISLGMPSWLKGINGRNILSANPTTTHATYKDRPSGATISMPLKK